MNQPDPPARPLRRLLLAAIPLLLLLGLVRTFAVALKDTSTDLPSVLVNRPAPEFDLPPLPKTAFRGSVEPTC